MDLGQRPVSGQGTLDAPQPRAQVRRPRALPWLLPLVAAFGCGDPSGSTPPDTLHADARSPREQCLELSATLGRCEVEGTGTDCMGVPGEERAFVPLTEGASLSASIGPQGALMFVFALRTTGIHPGDPDNPASTENPVVEIFLDDGVSEMSHYRGRPPFTSVDPETEEVEAAGLFVIIERTPSGIEGMPINAQATITDRDGEFRCGRVQFTATN